MTGLKIFLMFMSLNLLGACSLLESFHSQSPQYIEILIKEKQYHKAQTILQQISHSHPDYPALMAQKKRLQSLIHKLEKNTLTEVLKLQHQNKWQQAWQTLQSARSSLPEDSVLDKATQDFLAARKKRINELNMKINIHKGIWLKDAEPLLNAIVQTQPNDYDRRQQQQEFNQEKKQTLENLARCAKQAMNEELYELGRRCLALVNKIDKQHKYSQSLQQEKMKLQRHDHVWYQRQLRISDELVKELKQGYSHDNLLRASRHLRKLFSHNQSAEEKQYSKILKQELDKGIAQSMDAGRKLYSEGKITEALSIWTSLQQITPNNEVLEAHISRAQRVLKKLKQLGKQQPPVTKTAPSTQ
ncbi:hypothetical protein MNBD_GAMMA24-937 [hydrothermal vent metagenome]|uniref:Lipoprotein n=1 Tax=hydrothermal vent metagenome TaxID=652676 RepID=A0A3B1C809_9ZZZZ